MPFARNTRIVRTITGEEYKDDERNFTDGENYVMHSGWFSRDRKIYKHLIVEDKRLEELTTFSCNQDVLMTVGLALSGIALFVLQMMSK